MATQAGLGSRGAKAGGGRDNMAQLRLWSPDQEVEPEMPWDKMRWDGDRSVPDQEPRPDKSWRLSRWVLEYWRPWGLCAGEDPAREKTILNYFDATRWALRIGGDPLLEDLNAGWLAKVFGGLGTQTYARTCAKPAVARHLAAETQAKHRRALSTLVRELVWQGLVPPMRVRPRCKRRAGRVRPVPKPAYTVPELRKIVSQAETVAVSGFTGPRLRALWRSVYGIGFYTGLRREAWLSVTWAHVSATDGVWWLRVPAELAKDSEPWDGPLYGALVQELLLLRNQEDGRLIPWPHGADWLLARHKQISKAAGISGRGRDLHGLKRAHLCVLAEAGFDAEKRSLSLLAGHSDCTTTFSHYTPIGRLRAKYIPQMPPIW